MCFLPRVKGHFTLNFGTDFLPILTAACQILMKVLETTFLTGHSMPCGHQSLPLIKAMCLVTDKMEMFAAKMAIWKRKQKKMLH